MSEKSDDCQGFIRVVGIMQQIDLAKAAVGRRLGEERAKLNMSVTTACEQFGVSRSSWYGYEAGEVFPTQKILAALAAAGIDISYILTGQRGTPLPAGEGPGVRAAPLSSDEEWVLDCYRTATGEARRLIEQAARVAKEQVAPRQVTRPARVAPGRVKKVA